MPFSTVNTHLFIIQDINVHTKTCGPAINMLNIPITEPSVPGFIYCDNIANGNAQMLAQPIPDIPIRMATSLTFVVNAIPKNAIAIVSIEIICIFLFPNFTDKTPIGIATMKQTRLKIAKHTDEKFVPANTALS